MGQGPRLLFFLVTVILAVGSILLWPDYVVVSSTVKVILFASLITAAFSATLIEHFFTKPTDVVANATAALLLVLPARQELASLGWIYWGVATYYVTAIVTAATSILLYSFARDTSPRLIQASQLLKVVAVRIGNFKLIYGAAFYSTLFFYVQNSSTIFLVLATYFMAVLLLEPNEAFFWISNALKSDDIMAVGDVFGVQARNVFLAKLRPNRRALTRFQSVTFRYKLDDVTRNCLIVDSYLLNEEQWVKLVPTSDLASVPDGSQPNVVYHSTKQRSLEIVDRILGTVVEGSTIGLVRFEFASQKTVFQGKLVEIQNGEKKVLYQIVQGTTVEEVLERKNKSGAITGEAAQLGVWDSDKRRFQRHGWVPEINSLVLEPSVPADTQIAEGELKLGVIPGTQYPVIMNVDDAITHHLAVFGVTGSGKSVFARWLLKEYVKRDVLVLCVDNTLEYQKKLPPDTWARLITEQQNATISEKVNYISREMEKFANTRNHAAIRAREGEARDTFSEAIIGLVAGRIGILNLPDLQSTIEGLEYIRLFFSAVFAKAREGAFGDKRVCIVLEEAHTLVPEWNFNSGDEKRSQALVNTICQIALQGRKHNVGLIVIGQRTANVAKTVLTQCNSVVAFQQFDPTGLDFFSHYMGTEFAQGLSVLQSRRAVAVGKAFAAGVPLIFEVPEISETIPEEAAAPE
jgi:hypothetical protein